MKQEARTRGWLVTPFLLLAVACGSSSDKQHRRVDQPPSVILISVDTLRADKLGCYGHDERPTSPAIDALAADGVLFESFITSSPWTTPAHLTMLTSLYPSAHGLTASFREVMRDIQRQRRFYKLPERRVTLAEALRAAGFGTAAFTAGGTVAPGLGFGQGFSEYHSEMYKLDEQNMGRMTDWLREQRGHKFFLFWHTFEVHAPYLDTRFVTTVVPGERGRKLAADLAEATGKPHGGYDPIGRIAITQRHAQMRVLREHELFTPEVCEALYAGGVRSMDDWIAKLVAFLREAGLYHNVMIVLTSDHGEEFAERGPGDFYDRHGHTLYEELVHVPLIIKLPGQKHAGTRVREVARMVDVMPTILDLMEAPSPRAQEMQGTSLRGHWEREVEAPRTSPAFSEALAQFHEKKSVRDQRYKLIVSIAEKDVMRQGRSPIPASPEAVELYDLQGDPGERHNLAAAGPDGGAGPIADALEALLREFASGELGEVEPADLDDETLEKLRSLGYLE